MIDGFFRWLADWYLPDPGLLAGRIQGITWTLIDLVIVGSLLRIAAIACGSTPRVRWVLLALTAAASPLILFVPTEREFFALEAAICGTQFLLLVWTAWFERRAMLDLLVRKLRPGP